jgi:RHS repeat-associated protein
VTELCGRTVNYGYDSIYRLTSETIAGDPNNVNGAASYVYDAVGNRTQKTSTIPGFPGGLTNYNANDQLSTDTYDNDGNTTASNGLGYAYDFENHVVQAGAGITMVYDGDGNRVQKTVGGVTTKYLVDTQSPTGYAQVVYETFSGSTSASRETSRTFVYGLERISQFRSYFINGMSHTQTSYYVYDGHGSTRALTDPTGAVTDTYDYDAFGNLIHSTGTTPNNYLFAGEQFDADLGLYYNRARYLNVSTGRFWSQDSKDGSKWHPTSFHLYLYASQDPVNREDPSGKDDLAELGASEAVGEILETNPTATLAGEHALSEAGEIAEVESNVAEGEDLAFKGGRAAEEYLETTLQGEGQVSVETDQGVRVLDVLTENGEAAESKVGYVRYSERVLTQISKDAEILSRNLEGVKEITWNFFRSANTGLRGADPRIITELLNAGIKVVFH